MVLISTLTAGVLGVLAYYFLPLRYYATGSLFVRRSIYPYSEDHFTYEGYYGQQAAMAYANSVIGLIESDDVLAQTLSSLDMEVDQTSLRKYHKKIRTVKSGPQLIELITKEESPQEAEALWQATADSTIAAINNISRVNDPFVGVLKVSEQPVVKEGYRDLVTFSLAGAGAGLVLSLLYITIFTYFGTDPKK